MSRDEQVIVDILGNKLPAESAYFMQLMLVHYFVGLGLEVARIIPCAVAAVRRAAGPGLTPKERDTPWLGLNPLAVPSDFAPLQPALLSDAVLMFVILLVYAVLSPVTCFVMSFCFGASAIVYRNQCAFVYNPRGDSGGRLWPPAMRAILVCVVIGEVIVLVVLALKDGEGQAPLMVPLPVVTILLYLYLEQRHYHAAAHLPLANCVHVDQGRRPGSVSALDRGLYAPPSLRRRVTDGQRAAVTQFKGVANGTPSSPAFGLDATSAGGEWTSSSVVYVPPGSPGAAVIAGAGHTRRTRSDAVAVGNA